MFSGYSKDKMDGIYRKISKTRIVYKTLFGHNRRRGCFGDPSVDKKMNM
jgi:hypothetical protein